MIALKSKKEKKTNYLRQNSQEMWLPKNRACLLSKWKWNPSFKIALSVSHIDKEIAHRLVHKNYQSTITRVTTNTSNYDLRRFGQNAIIRNKDTELHSCSKMLIGPFGWIRSSRTEFTFFCWSCHKDLTYSRSLNNDLGTKIYPPLQSKRKLT